MESPSIADNKGKHFFNRLSPHTQFFASIYPFICNNQRLAPTTPMHFGVLWHAFSCIILQIYVVLVGFRGVFRCRNVRPNVRPLDAFRFLDVRPSVRPNVRPLLKQPEIGSVIASIFPAAKWSEFLPPKTPVQIVAALLVCIRKTRPEARKQAFWTDSTSDVKFQLSNVRKLLKYPSKTSLKCKADVNPLSHFVFHPSPSIFLIFRHFHISTFRISFLCPYAGKASRASARKNQCNIFCLFHHLKTSIPRVWKQKAFSRWRQGQPPDSHWACVVEKHCHWCVPSKLVITLINIRVTSASLSVESTGSCNILP